MIYITCCWQWAGHVFCGQMDRSKLSNFFFHLWTLLILHHNYSSPLLNLPSHSPSSIPFSLSPPRKGRSPIATNPPWHIKSLWNCTYPLTLRADQEVQLAEQDHQTGNRVRVNTHSSGYGTYIYGIYVGYVWDIYGIHRDIYILDPACECFLTDSSVSLSPQESRLIDSADLLVEFLPHPGSMILPAIHSQHFTSSI